MTLKELRQQRSAKATRGKAALTEHNALAAKADRTEADDAKLAELAVELDTLEREVSELDAKIQAEEAVARRGALFNTAPAATTSPRAVSPGFRSFEPNPERTGGFKALTEFALAVQSAQTGQGLDPRLANIEGGAERGAAPAGYQQNGGSAGEGFLVPTEYREGIWSLAFDEPDLLSMCAPEPTAGNSVKMLKDETTPWGAAGVTANWRAEGSQMVASKAAATGMLVELHELYAYVLATNEVLSDGPRLMDRMTVQAARAVSWTASDSIMWGDGNGKLLGFMNSAALVTVSKESGQAADTLAVKNVTKMNARVLRAGGKRPIFLMNSDLDPELASLTIGDVPAFLPNNQPLTSPYEGFLRGKPVLYTEHCKALGDKGDTALCDFSGYKVFNKAGGVDFAASIHLFFDYNISAFRWIFRLGGQPVLSAPVAGAKAGASTKSHFVTLEAR